ncbi:MAG: phospholipase D-like domain-containing protein [Actinomycetota bacterium]|nr:phospholipase D-like domain-containing protein [Actinomycetota bacterium]
MDLTTLLSTYVTTDPPKFAGCKITPLLDAEEYNAALAKALASVGTDPDPNVNKAKGDFIAIAGWWLGLVGGKWKAPMGSGFPDWTPHVEYPPYDLAGIDLVDVLAAKAKAGVETRVMGWTHFGVLSSGFATRNVEWIPQLNTLTLASVRKLRGVPEIDGNAILNVISHTGGSAHAKVVIVGNDTEAVAFTGGIDFVADRWATALHPAQLVWHDVVAQVEGPAVQGLYDWFRFFWTENLEDGAAPREHVTFRLSSGKVTHVTGTTTAMNARSFLTMPAKGDHHAQVLQTLPAYKYDLLSIAPSAPRSRIPVTGDFRLRDAWQKAITAATTYVYIEDQAFWSAEVMSWVNTALRSASAPDLRVVLVIGASKDPNDPAMNDHPLLCQSLNDSLLAGLTSAELDRVRMYRRWGDSVPLVKLGVTKVTPGTIDVTLETSAPLAKAVDENALVRPNQFARQGAASSQLLGNPAGTAGSPLTLRVAKPATGSYVAGTDVELFQLIGVYVHTKTTLVDDHWAMIGSANVMRRSLYTDCESSVAFVDEHDTAVRDYRARLWAHHFRHPTPGDFSDVKASLHAWEPGWFAGGGAPARPTRSGAPGPEYLEPVPLPVAGCSTPPLDEKTKRFYDLIQDVDSRTSWGFVWQP